MAYGTPPEAPRTKPTTVNLAVIMLYLYAGLSVVSAIVGLLSYNGFKEGYAKAYEGTNLAGTEGGSATGQVASTIVVGAILAILFIVLAILVSRGNRVGRILAWVFSGLALCCTGGLYALTAFAETGWNASREQNPSLPTYEQFQNDLNAALPSWYGPVTTIILVVSVLALLGAIILLALPASHPYFRKREEPLWEPPIPPAPGGPAGPSGPTGPTGPTTPPPAESGPAT